MAETFLFIIAERVVQKIIGLTVGEVCLASTVRTDLKKLKDTIISIKAVLLDAERQQHQNEKLRLCMWKLRDIFYDAEDVIDDFKCEALRKQDAIDHPNTNSSKLRERYKRNGGADWHKIAHIRKVVITDDFGDVKMDESTIA
ncbi:putative disease resistance RPP13-like protein 1 [Gossypium arboreum]|uniref:putative disease resistance RPP13-like protein 1 n=1 Tax=Gossypium arboreum TaxID=29729 RepID=UPI0022F1D420|nr:putative disease resistance RPP13-like protein 1 [Gossypium arboreum]